jgi:hypothetical protein
VWSPVAVRRTNRATLVMPTLFAITYKGFGNLQMALCAGFGSFATLGWSPSQAPGATS